MYIVKHRASSNGIIITGKFTTWWEAENHRVEWLRDNGAFGSWIEQDTHGNNIDLPIGIVARGHLGAEPENMAHSTLPMSGYNVQDIPRAVDCPRKGYWLDIDKLHPSTPYPLWLIVNMMEFKGYKVYRQDNFITFASV